MHLSVRLRRAQSHWDDGPSTEAKKVVCNIRLFHELHTKITWVGIINTPSHAKDKDSLLANLVVNVEPVAI